MFATCKDPFVGRCDDVCMVCVVGVALRVMLLLSLNHPAGMLLCVLRDILPKKYAGYVPSPMAMGIPFYIGANSVRALHYR